MSLQLIQCSSGRLAAHVVFFKRLIRKTDFPELDAVKDLIKVTDLSLIFETSFLHLCMNMFRGELLFSLQIICPFSCCSDICTFLFVLLEKPAYFP